ncbi:MAG: lysophospholipid acyltransferase family protein [Moheibacter sp.]
MKILAYPLSALYYIFFGLTLVIMHIVQWLCFNLGGYKPHHASVKIMNFLLIGCTKLLGTTHKFKGRKLLPKNTPIIFVSNHQSVFDISPTEWYLSDFHPKFISKIELGKGIPSVSYNLQHGGSVLIDRKDPRQALPEIKKLSQYIEKHNRSAIIFPEGTRSRDGKLKYFRDSGLKMLLKFAPSALIVPITINNSWKIVKNGSFPLSLGIPFSVEIHAPLNPKEFEFEVLMEEIQKSIRSTLKN